MATTHIDRMRDTPNRDAARAVCEELHALALRRAAHHEKENTP
ncbi:hypothetical protein [Brachybacterium sp. J153]|nr:hypothetical protein [Brachybacterium sp. J153]MEE1617316.1 hypothetical protein [Brachybacterium sp. J153]